MYLVGYFVPDIGLDQLTVFWGNATFAAQNPYILGAAALTAGITSFTSYKGYKYIYDAIKDITTPAQIFEEVRIKLLKSAPKWLLISGLMDMVAVTIMAMIPGLGQSIFNDVYSSNLFVAVMVYVLVEAFSAGAAYKKDSELTV